MLTSALLVGFFAVPLCANPSMTLSRASFDPSLHQSVSFTVAVTEPGTLTVRVVDRDTYVTKTLANGQRVSPGPVTFVWDGTDNDGNVVPDEAWSVRADFQGEHPWTYFPASQSPTMSSITPDFFDRTSGVLRYTLPTASRVHLQAGIADRTTGVRTAGAVMKTLVNRAPRPGGAVIEQWSGMDESGTIYVPALPNFVVAIAATPLPENSVITYGNRHRDFLSVAMAHAGKPLLQAKHEGHAHHQGLTALDDATPRLTAMAGAGARWDERSKSWIAKKMLHVRVALDGPTAERFAAQPARLLVYVDQRKVIDRPTSQGRDLTIPLPAGTEHVVAVNWASDFGPVAATAFRTQVN